MKYLFDGAYFPKEIFETYPFRVWMQQKGLSQAEFARKLMSTQSGLSRIASRDMSASLLLALKIMHFSNFDFHLEDLLSSKDLLELQEFRGKNDTSNH